MIACINFVPDLWNISTTLVIERTNISFMTEPNFFSIDQVHEESFDDVVFSSKETPYIN